MINFEVALYLGISRNTQRLRQRKTYQHATLTSENINKSMKPILPYMKTNEKKSSSVHDVIYFVTINTAISDRMGYSLLLPKT